MGLTVDVNISPETDLLGKHVTDLQSDVVVTNDNVISGSLKYVTGYTGFSGNVEEQSGNYFALHFATEAEDTTITCEVIGGRSGPVNLDPDGLIVVRVFDKNLSMRVVATKDGEDPAVMYLSFRGLTLEPPAESD